MRSLNLLIKPASGTCNLRCAYCFYADVSANRHTMNYGMMRRDTAEAMIRRALDEAQRIAFCFQGGEPTLWGLDNYRFFVETVDRLNTARAEIHYALQTNGTLLNDDWAAFFKDCGFLIGLSLDGYRDIHDANRVDAAGQSSFSKVIKAAALLRKAGAEFNILSVVTPKTARQTEKLYHFYQSQNLKYLQFIPCIDDFASAGTTLTADQYGQFLNALFDLWYRDCMAERGISIRYFDNLLGLYMGHPPEQCTMNGICTAQFTVEANGGVYPCDFYVLDKWRLGDVHTDSFESMLASEAAKQFVSESMSIRAECSFCRWYKLCRGGCKRDREPVVDGVPSSNRFCAAYRDFFNYSHERWMKLCTYFSR